MRARPLPQAWRTCAYHPPRLRICRYKIEFSDDQDKPRVQLKYPQGMTGPQPQPYVPPPASALPVQQAPNHLTGMTPAPYGQPMSGPGPEATPPPVPPTQAGSSATQNTKKAPIEFDQAINYVTKIKKTFEDKPGTYRAFLEILHTYQKEQKSIKAVSYTHLTLPTICSV